MVYTPREFPRIGRGVSRFVSEEYRSIAQSLKRFANGVLTLRDNDDSHDLTIELDTDLTQARTLTLQVPDADTTLEITGDAAIEGTNTGDQTIELTGDVTGSGTGTFAATIAANAVTYAKMQDVSATDKVLGRSTAGAGDVEEIPCTAAGRALLAGALASDQRTTLGLGTAAVLDVGTGANNIVQLDGTPKLPAVDGSALTNLPQPGWTLIETQEASSSATIDFETGLDDTYDDYEIRISSAKPANDDVEMRMRVGTGAGPVTYQADAADYYWQTMHMAGATSAISGDASDSEMVLSSTAGGGGSLGNNTDETFNGTVRFSNPESAANMKHFHWSGTYNDPGGIPRPYLGGGAYLTAEAITAIRFLMSTGNIASGRFSLYGLKKA
jgi:hypothetical protein